MPNDPTPSPKAPPPGRKFPCVKCGARLDFDPKGRALLCPYCGHVETIEPTAEGPTERDLEEYLARQTGESTVAGRPVEVKCQTCGAVVLLEDKVAAHTCPYCATFLESQPHAAQAMIQPEGVLPFAVAGRQASANFRAWIAGLWFAPNALKQFAHLGRLTGAYVPFWTFDAMTYTRYEGERGDHYWDTETYTTVESYTDSDGQTRTREVTKTRQVRRTRWTPAAGAVEHFFDDVLVCASTSLPEPYVARITPGELTGLEGFRPEFLSGFVTERYTVGPKDGFDRAKGVMDATVRGLCLRDIGGDEQRLHAVRTRHVGVTYKHVLLPVWLASYRYQDRPYRVIVNGLTGAVYGDRPYSVWKIFFLVVAILAALALVALAVLRLGGGAGASGAPRGAPARPLLADLHQQRVGDLVGGAEGVGPHLHLPFVEVPAGLGPGQAGDLQRQRQQLHELADLLPLPFDGRVVAHGMAPGGHGDTPVAYPAGPAASKPPPPGFLDSLKNTT